jgi:hypothetical protein
LPSPSSLQAALFRLPPPLVGSPFNIFMLALGGGWRGVLFMIPLRRQPVG